MDLLRLPLLHTSVGLFIKKDTKEVEKMKEGLVHREIEQVKRQLDGLARSHLLSSATFYMEGVFHLFKLKSMTGEDQAKMALFEEGIEDRQVAVYASRSPIDHIPMKDLKLTKERALSAAKEDFEQARINAIKAFNNEALSPCDRILAMTVRVAATMLENVDHPEDALPVCIQCLEELHALPEVKESFRVEINKPFKYHFSKEHRRQIISSVCRINHAVRNAAVMIVKEGKLNWPLIAIGVENIDPLHDPRVAESLGKLEMQHYSATALTLGQKKLGKLHHSFVQVDEEDKPLIMQGKAVTLQWHFYFDCGILKTGKLKHAEPYLLQSFGWLPMEERYVTTDYDGLPENSNPH